MIHVSVRPEEIPAWWFEKSARLMDELRGCVDDGDEMPTSARETAVQKRRAVFDRNADHWRALKEILTGWSHEKCWYSELKDVGSDKHVDHFRPKGRVAELDGTIVDGYWWLAFDWTNYRVAVAWCNSPHRSIPSQSAQGKSDSFPLKEGSPRASVTDSCDVELPYLLDPVNPTDALLLSYDESGMPYSTAGGWPGARVLETVRILHLDARQMVEERQRKWRQCERYIRRVASALASDQATYQRFHDVTVNDWIEEICELLRPNAELSSVALACVSSSEHAWARLLPRHPHAQLV